MGFDVAQYTALPSKSNRRRRIEWGSGACARYCPLDVAASAEYHTATTGRAMGGVVVRLNRELRSVAV